MRWAAAAVIAAGAAVRFRIFLANRSLSIDEAAVGRNLIAHSWRSVFGPLAWGQVAPPGFLAIEKAAVSLDPAEYALRALPLACGLVSLWLCWKLAARLQRPAPALCTLALVAGAPSLAGYAAVAKPYSGDVAAALAVALAAVTVVDPWRREPPTRTVVVAAALTALFSFTASFGLAAAAAACLAAAWRAPRARVRPLVAAAAIWAAAGGFAVYAGRRVVTPADSAYLHWFWASGFMPFPPHDLREAAWIWPQLKSLFGITARYRFTTFWIACAAMGIVSLVRRRPLAAIAVAGPMLLAIAASAAGGYPFASGRLELFLLPPALLLAAEGADALGAIARSRAAAATLVPLAALLLLAAPSLTAGAPPDPRDDLRPFLEQASARWEAGDALYVYHGTAQAFLYYAPRFRFPPGDVLVGSCSRGSGRVYLAELDRLRGRRRAWIALPRDENAETDLFLAYLDAIGRRLPLEASLPASRGLVPVGYLYDLTASARGAAVHASTFPLPAALGHVRPYQWACYGVFTPASSVADAGPHGRS
ncbi:MAG TPA: hypothetical protein VL309_10175 [Vicinamibacterales bacterium]|nr:hypothetical protein [Vicinamibacterales bacterium]